MTVQQRVRRLLSKRFPIRSNDDENVHLDGDFEKRSTEATEASSTTTLSSDEASFDADDPYADVRDQLETLSANDRARYCGEDALSAFAQLQAHDVPMMIAYTCYLGYAVLLLLGRLRDVVGGWTGYSRYRSLQSTHPSDDRQKFAPLLSNWEKTYTRRIYNRIQDCFNRPISSAAGVRINVLERVSGDGYKSMDVLGAVDPSVAEDYAENPHLSLDNGRLVRRCLNLGSYNYLGFADDWQSTCAESVHSSLDCLPISMASSLGEFGNTALHSKVESTVAEFLGKPAALVLNMGFNVNATVLPAIVGRGDLLISDQLNHTSIVCGARASGAAIRVFHHNDIRHLEKIVREAIVYGRPRTRRPWNKILIVVEGVYSMEGEYCDLKGVVGVAKKYGCYTYLDEAHSIGAMGPTGRGCAEYTGVPTSSIDIMMGTFTKSFAGMGGYIAGDNDLIACLRRRCAGAATHNAISPVVCQQVLTSFNVIMGKDSTSVGKQKLQALRDNSNYFRMRLQEMGLEVLGQYDSPVIPVMLYHMTKIAAFSRECLKRGLAVVVVGAPAVPVLECRARFCMSAGHTRDDLDWALGEIEEIVDIVKIRRASGHATLEE